MNLNRDGRPSTSPRNSSLSPFPFGTPITFSDRSLLSPGRRNSAEGSSLSPNLNHPSSSQTNNVQHVIRGRIRAQDVYGGPLMFGGNSSLRRNRLLAASPYEMAAAMRSNRPSRDPKPKPSNAPTPSTSKSTTPTSEDGMSSTARLILDTLERMSTPVRDAQKIPIVARAEKRRQVMSELESSLSQGGQTGLTPSSKRRRPNLGSNINPNSPNSRTLLNGPPVRAVMTPVANTPRTPRPNFAIKSARISSNATVTKSIEATIPICNTSPNPAFLVNNAATTTTTTTGESRKSNLVTEKSDSTFPFSLSVPALSGGTPIIANHDSVGSLFSAGGKMRSKIGEKSAIETNQPADPLPPHLSKPASSGLELKGMPSFGINFLKQKPAQQTSIINNGESSLRAPSSSTTSSILTDSLSKSSSKTADTVLLSPERPLPSIFSFSEPISINSGTAYGNMNGGDDAVVPTSRFTFSQPEAIIIPVSKVAEKSGKQNNLTSLPDFLTSAKSRVNSSATILPLKSGSVMDILGGMTK